MSGYFPLEVLVVVVWLMFGSLAGYGYRREHYTPSRLKRAVIDSVIIAGGVFSILLQEIDEQKEQIGSRRRHSLN